MTHKLYFSLIATFFISQISFGAAKDAEEFGAPTAVARGGAGVSSLPEADPTAMATGGAGTGLSSLPEADPTAMATGGADAGATRIGAGTASECETLLRQALEEFIVKARGEIPSLAKELTTVSPWETYLRDPKSAPGLLRFMVGTFRFSPEWAEILRNACRSSINFETSDKGNFASSGMMDSIAEAYKSFTSSIPSHLLTNSWKKVLLEAFYSSQRSLLNAFTIELLNIYAERLGRECSPVFSQTGDCVLMHYLRKSFPHDIAEDAFAAAMRGFGARSS